MNGPRSFLPNDNAHDTIFVGQTYSQCSGSPTVLKTHIYYATLARYTANANASTLYCKPRP